MSEVFFSIADVVTAVVIAYVCTAFVGAFLLLILPKSAIPPLLLNVLDLKHGGRKPPESDDDQEDQR